MAPHVIEKAGHGGREKRSALGGSISGPDGRRGQTFGRWAVSLSGAVGTAAEVMALCDQRGIFTYFTVGSRLLTHLAGGGGPGLDELSAEVARLQTGGVLARRVFHASLLAEAYGNAGEAGRGLEVLATALKAVAAGAERYYESALHRLRGELLLAAGPSAEDVDVCFRRAIATAQAIGARSLELRAATSLARRLAERGAFAEARAALAPVLGAFAEGHDTRDLRSARALLSEIA